MATRTSFSCGDALDINLALSLQSRLEKSLNRASTIELKADSIKRADTAGLQLFVCLAREVAQRDGKLIWKKPTNELTQAAALLGLADELGLK